MHWGDEGYSLENDDDLGGNDDGIGAEREILRVEI